MSRARGFRLDLQRSPVAAGKSSVSHTSQTSAQQFFSLATAPRVTAQPLLTLENASGEQTAAALEANLTSLESKLDALLASMEAPAGNAAPSVPQGKTGKQGEAQADQEKNG